MKPYYRKYYVKGTANHIFDICNELNWITKRTARHELFMSDKDITYSYGNKFRGAESYKTVPYNDTIKWIEWCLNQDIFDDGYNGTYNACFLNKYDDQHQHLGWHADDFDGMDKDAPIAVVSLGAEREIWWKPKGFKGEVPKENRQLLEHGSIFVMPVGFQEEYLHKIPKHDQPCGPRISLTFRKFL